MRRILFLVVIASVFVVDALGDGSQYWKAYPERVGWLAETQIVAPSVSLSMASEAFVTCYLWSSVLFEAEGLRWPTAELARALDEQRPLVMGFSPITAAEATFWRRPELTETACRDIDGEKLILEWYPVGVVSPFYQCCTNNTVWQDFLLERIFAAIDLGVDGIMLDEIYGTVNTIWNGGCFCKYCMDGFRAFLASRYSASWLRSEFGIQDIESFDYGEYINSRGFAGAWKTGRQNIAPLFADYQVYQQQAVFLSMKRVIGDSREYAEERYGVYMPFCANINDLNTSGLKFTDLLDWFFCETFYKDLGYPPTAKVLPVTQLAKGLGRQAWFLPSITTNADLLTWPSTDALQRLLLADAYSGGGVYHLPYEIYAFDETTGRSTGGYTANSASIAPYYRFALDNSFLFQHEDQHPASIGLIYPFCSITEGVWSTAHEPFLDVAAALFDAGIPYDVLPIGDGFYLSNTLADVPLDSYECVIIPPDSTLPVYEAHLLRDFSLSGGQIISLSDEATAQLSQWGGLTLATASGALVNYSKAPSTSKLLDFLASTPETLQEERIELLTVSSESVAHVNAWTTVTDEDMAIHLVNYDYIPRVDRVSPKTSIRVRFPASSLPFPAAEASAYVLSPEAEAPVRANWKTVGAFLEVEVDAIEIWSVVYILTREREQALLSDLLAALPCIVPPFCVGNSDAELCSTPSHLSPLLARQQVLDCAWSRLPERAETDVLAQSPRVEELSTLERSLGSLIDDFSANAPRIGGRYNYDFNASDDTFFCSIRKQAGDDGNHYKAFQFCHSKIFKFRLDQIPGYDASSYAGIELTIWANEPMLVDWEVAFHSSTQEWTGVWLPDMAISTIPRRYRLPFVGFDPLPSEQLLEHLFAIAAWPEAECGTVYWDDLILYRTGSD